MIAYIVSGNGIINAVVNNKNYTLPPTSQFYQAAKQALKDKNEAEFLKLCDFDQQFRERSNGRVTFEGGVIRYNGTEINNALTQRILELVKLDFDFEPLVKFLENLYKNPSESARDELYLFLEANSLPITDDGHFLAYRRVDSDYTSLHANPDGSKNKNTIGAFVEMPRELVNPNRDETCERGLHFCSVSYLPHYGTTGNGGKTVIVKINPKDVVSIPSDYDNQKGRCCRYEVIGEYEPNDNQDVLKDVVVYSETKHYTEDDIRGELQDIFESLNITIGSWEDSWFCNDLDEFDLDDLGEDIGYAFPFIGINLKGGDTPNELVDQIYNKLNKPQGRDHQGRFTVGHTVTANRDEKGRFIKS